MPLQSTPCQGYWFQDVPVVDNLDRDGPFKPIGLGWQGADEWLERVGYEPDAGMSPDEVLNPALIFLTPWGEPADQAL